MATPPRRVLPGTCYLVTRRCSERRFFLRPSRTTNEIFLFVLAVAARRYNVRIHAFCVLSNHCHLVLTDVEGRLPEFMQYVDALVARAVNASLGRFEGFWASDGSYSAVEPLAPEDLVAKVAYVLANPVAAGLVRHGREWPGLWTAPEDVGRARLVARRPDVFFDPKGSMPQEVELQLDVPAAFESAEQFRSLVSTELERLEEKHAREVQRRGRRFVGVARVLAQAPTSSPPPGEPRFELSPRMAARDKWRRIEALSRLRSFMSEYRDAWAAWKRGVRSVVFPHGTYLLRVLHGVQCASA